MLGSDRFKFETPNVIDPGDAPPSQPRRASQPRQSARLGSGQSYQGLNTNGANNEYQQDRKSSARLLNDINDLDLSPSIPLSSARVYNDVGADQDDDGPMPVADGTGAQQRTANEARDYATSLLDNADRRYSSPSRNSFAGNNAGGTRINDDSDLEHSMPMDAIGSVGGAGSKHLVRRRICSSLFTTKVCGGITAVVVIIILIAALAGSGNSSNSFLAPPTPPPTHAPTEAPTLHPHTRLEDVSNFLLDHNLVTQEDLNNDQSPQTKAAEWIANGDPLGYTLPTGDGSVPPGEDGEAGNPPKTSLDEAAFSQRFNLAEIYYALDGPNWKDGLNFLSEKDACDWNSPAKPVDGYEAYDYKFGVTCDDQHAAIGLYIPANELKGALPSRSKLFKQLELLALPDNQLSGEIPAQLFHSNLLYLDLSKNKLVGTIPDQIGEANLLQVLRLTSNQLGQEVPASIGNLAGLKTLALGENSFSGLLDNVVNPLLDLEFLFVNHNQFEGAVDKNFLAGHEKLVQVDLSRNRLTSTNFPAHLLEHPALSTLDLSLNRMKGEMPMAIATNQVMRYLSVSGNELSGGIGTTSLTNLFKLSHLDLRENKFTGELVNEFGKLHSLEYLGLGSNNWLAKPMPSWLIKLKKLRDLRMSDMHMVHDIPVWIDELPELEFIDISGNKMSGPLPEELLSLPKLKYLFLHNNTLEGVIPLALASQDLVAVSIHKNNLYGDANHICDVEKNLDFFALDCNGGEICSQECCPTCCKPDDDDCFKNELIQVMSVFDRHNEYTVDQTAFDPAILG